MLLKIETDEGMVGWGEPVIEGRARTVEAAVHEMSHYLVGQDPARITAMPALISMMPTARGIGTQPLLPVPTLNLPGASQQS